MYSMHDDVFRLLKPVENCVGESLPGVKLWEIQIHYSAVVRTVGRFNERSRSRSSTTPFSR